MTGIDHLVSLWRYDETSAPLIAAAKSVGGGSLLRELAVLVATKARPFTQPLSIVSWVPASPAGKRRRGFDQGRVMASHLGRRLGIPSHPSLVRVGRAQFGGSRQHRLTGPQLSIRSDWVRRPAPQQVLLVDDVVTTGTSLARSAELIRSSGPVSDIVGVVLAVRLSPYRSVLIADPNVT